MANYGVNIKVGVQGQNNAKQLGEQIREIVRGLEAADRAFTQFSNNLKSFDQRRAQRKINEELDKTAQKYRELDRLQRQLLANDNSAIKAAERRAKLEEHISKNISAGRIRRQSARQQFLAGDPGQYATTIGPQPDRIAQIRKIAAAEEQAARQVAGIRNQLFRDLNRTQIDLLQEKIKREMDAQQEVFNNAMRLNQKAADDFDRRLAQATRNRSEATRLTGQTSPVGGAVGIPGSPAALAAVARAQRIKSAQGSALIGGAFPLLFGQGLGAAAGGAVGGFGGGMIGGEFGFGLSLVGTQIGTLIDRLATKAIDLGKALDPLTADTEAIIGAVGKSNTAFASLVQELEAAGESAFALELASQELEKVVGKNGVEAFELFSARIVDLQNEVAVLTTKIGAFVAELINTITGETPGVRQARERSAGIFEARQSKDPEIVAAVAALDALGADPKARIAQQEKILDLLENGTKAQREALRLRQLDVKLGKDQARLIDQSTSLTALNTELIALGEDKHTAQGIALQQNIARQVRLNSIEKAYKDFAEDNLTLAGLRATLRGVEADFAEKIATIDAAAARHATKQDEKRQRAAESRIKTIEREIERTDKVFDKANSHIDKIIKKHQDKVAFEQEYSRLIQEGSTPAAARQAIELEKQLLELDRAFEKHIEILDAQIDTTEAAIAEARVRDGVTAALQEQIDKLDELKKKRAGLFDAQDDAADAIEKALTPKTGAQNIQAEIDRVEGTLNKLIDPANQVILAAQAIGDAFSESFKGLIRGSMSAQEALANLFSRTADHFADMAAQIIAKQIQMKILGIALNFFGGGAGGGDSFAGVPNSTLDSVLPSTESLANAASAGRFAAGGYVSGPTNALIGEGGQPEYVIPASKMTEAMGRYARGARGAAVIPEGDGASTEGGMGGGSGVVDVRYSVERINNVDYVTAAEFERGMNQAAKRGAELGRQGVYSDLVNKRSVRSRVGV